MHPNSGRSGSAPSSFTARSSAGRLLLDLPVKNPLAFSRLGKPDRTKVRRLRCTRCATAASRLSARPLRDAQFSHPSVYVATHDQTEPPRNQGAPARLACRAHMRLWRQSCRALPARPQPSTSPPVARSHHDGEAKHLARTVPSTRRGQGAACPQPPSASGTAHRTPSRHTLASTHADRAPRY